jgi:hypothetical protein
MVCRSLGPYCTMFPLYYTLDKLEGYNIDLFESILWIFGIEILHVGYVKNWFQRIGMISITQKPVVPHVSPSNILHWPELIWALPGSIGNYRVKLCILLPMYLVYSKWISKYSSELLWICWTDHSPNSKSFEHSMRQYWPLVSIWQVLWGMSGCSPD